MMRVRWERLKVRAFLARRRSRENWNVFAENRLAVLGLVIIAIFGVLAILYPVLRATVWKSSVYDPVTGYDMKVMHPSLPSTSHWLGTDGLGRDVFSMMLAATRSAFAVGITAAISTAVIGVVIGVVSAYRGGAVDMVLMHISDAFLLLPAPLFMVIIGMRCEDIGPGALGLIYGFIAGAGGTAIVMRSHALTVVAKPFIEAARIAGGGGARIMWCHIAPHMLPLTALYMMLAVTNAVVADAFIAFFGFSRNYLSWGTIIYSSFVYSSYVSGGIEWHVLIPPSVSLSTFAAAFYLVSRGLHLVADPRLRQR